MQAEQSPETWCYFFKHEIKGKVKKSSNSNYVLHFETTFRQLALLPHHIKLNNENQILNQTLYFPTNRLNCINCRVIKNTLKCKSRSKMFRFTKEPSSGSHNQCQLKLQVWFHCACRYERCQCYGCILRPVLCVCVCVCVCVVHGAGQEGTVLS